MFEIISQILIAISPVPADAATPSHSQLIEIYTRSSTPTQIEIEELMKLHYLGQNWSKFFGYATYYRLKFKAKERSDVQLLEALALLRHCQSDALGDLLVQLHAESPHLKAHLDQIHALSQTRFAGKSASEAREPSRLKAHFEGHFLKKTDHKKILNLNPHKILFKVQNQC